MADLTVHYGGYRREAHCSKVEEGDDGLFLLDDHEEQIGWIPYSSVNSVVDQEAVED